MAEQVSVENRQGQKGAIQTSTGSSWAKHLRTPGRSRLNPVNIIKALKGRYGKMALGVAGAAVLSSCGTTNYGLPQSGPAARGALPNVPNYQQPSFPAQSQPRMSRQQIEEQIAYNRSLTKLHRSEQQLRRAQQGPRGGRQQSPFQANVRGFNQTMNGINRGVNQLTRFDRSLNKLMNGRR